MNTVWPAPTVGEGAPPHGPAACRLRLSFRLDPLSRAALASIAEGVGRGTNFHHLLFTDDQSCLDCRQVGRSRRRPDVTPSPTYSAELRPLATTLLVLPLFKVPFFLFSDRAALWNVNRKAGPTLAPKRRVKAARSKRRWRRRLQRHRN